MARFLQFFTAMHNRICEQTDLTGYFDLARYGMMGCLMFHRSARITNRTAYRQAKPDRMENSADSSATRTARHGWNPHSWGNFTFFSFEEGSNFVQNIRHSRTSSNRWTVSFSYPPPPTHPSLAPILRSWRYEASLPKDRRIENR